MDIESIKLLLELIELLKLSIDVRYLFDETKRKLKFVKMNEKYMRTRILCRPAITATPVLCSDAEIKWHLL